MGAGQDKIVGANAGRSRSHNRRVVLRRVRDAGQIGRAEIARSSGLSTQAVSNIIADLMDDGLILEQGRRLGVRGLPAVQYALNPTGGYALGFEIRPDAVFAALLDFEGTAVFSERKALDAPERSEIVGTVLALKIAALRAVPRAGSRMLGVGIVMPGPFGRTGIRESGSELAGWDDADPTTVFSEALGLPVYVEKDANAAAMSERLGGAAEGIDSFAYLYFGTGLGLGLVHQGAVVRGGFGNAGEIGHIPVPIRGGTAPLESLVSRMAAQSHLSAAGHPLRSMDELGQAYADGNSALLEWLTLAREPLSAAISTIENLFDPETIVLGGALPDALIDHLIGSIALAERSVANREIRQHPRLMRGRTGRMTATLGAAAMVIHQAMTPRIAVAQ